MTNTYFTSDSHFHHQNIIKHAKRPFHNMEEMHEEMINSWNNKIGKRDDVFYVGDLTLSTRIEEIDEILSRLNGNIHVVKGNHDNWTKKVHKLKNNYKIKWIKDYHELKFTHGNEKQLIVLCHFPFRTWNKSHHGSIHIHGHTHGFLNKESEDLNIRRLDVGVDAIGPDPISLEEVMKLMNKRFQNTIHHEPRDDYNEET